MLEIPSPDNIRVLEAVKVELIRRYFLSKLKVEAKCLMDQESMQDECQQNLDCLKLIIQVFCEFFPDEELYEMGRSA